MNTKHRRVLGLLVGAAAVAAMATFTVDHAGGMSMGHDISLAGSDDAPTNTVYVQPTLHPMKIGATMTETIPTTQIK